MRAPQVNFVGFDIPSQGSLHAEKLVYTFQNLRAVREFQADVGAMLFEKHLVESDVPLSESDSSDLSESSV